MASSIRQVRRDGIKASCLSEFDSERRELHFSLIRVQRRVRFPTYPSALRYLQRYCKAMSSSPRCRSSPEAASTQAQAGSVPSAGNDESNSPPQSPRENGNNEPSPLKRPFALQQWLSESRKDGPYNILASARAAASGQAESVPPPSAGTQDGPLNADKQPSG
ncbi:hypothetical protein V8C40DRAFT_155881 [Trichoderma camerunense]